MTQEIWFHVIEISVMILGVALPVSIAAFRLVSLFKDFPPHLHVNGKIMYPKGYEPPVIIDRRKDTIDS